MQRCRGTTIHAHASFHRHARSYAVIAMAQNPETKQAQARTNEDIMKIPNIDKRFYLRPRADDPNSG